MTAIMGIHYDIYNFYFQHGILVESHQKEAKPKQIKTSYDPFKLIPCLSFDEENPVSLNFNLSFHFFYFKTKILNYPCQSLDNKK